MDPPANEERIRCCILLSLTGKAAFIEKTRAESEARLAGIVSFITREKPSAKKIL
jgi:hypothetical protein